MRPQDVLSLAKLAGTDQRYFPDQAQRRVDHTESVSSGAEDSYLSGREAAGEWTGSASALLGLGGRVSEGTLRGVLPKHNPRRGQLLDGSVRRARVPGFGLMFSGPKELYPDVVDGLEEGGVPSRLLKTDAGDARQEGTPWQMSQGLPIGKVEEVAISLDELVREGARRMIAAALKVEVDEFVEEVGDDGKRLVVRNGRARERKVTLGSGTVPIKAPRVNDKRVDPETGERHKFSSKILPAYARRSPKVTEVLPVLYLHGLSTGDFEPALRDLLGEDAGVSASSISRLTQAWQAEHDSSAPGASGSTATPTSSSTACTSRCAWARTTACACSW